MTDQMSGGERLARVLMFLSSCLFNICFTSVSVTFHVMNKSATLLTSIKRDCLKMHAIIPSPLYDGRLFPLPSATTINTSDLQHGRTTHVQILYKLALTEYKPTCLFVGLFSPKASHFLEG